MEFPALIQSLTEFSQSEKLHFVEQEWHDIMETEPQVTKYELEPLPSIAATLFLAVEGTPETETLPLKEIGTTFIQAFSGVSQRVYGIRAFVMA